MTTNMCLICVFGAVGLNPSSIR